MGLLIARPGGLFAEPAPASSEKLWMGEFRLRKLVVHRPQPDGSLRADISRIGTDRQVDLSGYFNDSDASQVVRAAIAELEKSPLLAARPAAVLSFDRLRNRTSTHFNSLFIMQQLEAWLGRSGKVRLVSRPTSGSPNFRGAAASAASRWRQPTSSAEWSRRMKSRREDRLRVSFQVSLEALSVATGQKVWGLSKSIDKVGRDSP